MKLFVFFGLPGAGKSFAGKIVEKYFDYHVYDGDNDLTEELHAAFQNQAVVTDSMREAFFNKLIQSIKKLIDKYDRIIIHQTFIKEKYRKQFLNAIPEAKFVLIETDTPLREKRLRERKYYPLDEEYARKMTLLFDKPIIRHTVLNNNIEGEESLKKQLQKILL